MSSDKIDCISNANSGDFRGRWDSKWEVQECVHARAHTFTSAHTNHDVHALKKTRVCPHGRTCACTHTHPCEHARFEIHAHEQTLTCVHKSMKVHAYIFAHTRKRTRTSHAHTQTHVHVHIDMDVCA